MAARLQVTQQYVEAYGELDARTLRVIAQNVEVVGTLDAGTLKVISQNVEVVGTTTTSIYADQQYVSVAGTKTGSAKLGQFYVEVLQRASYQAIGSLTFTHAVTGQLTGVRDAISSVSLVHSSTVAKYNPSQYATGTISLSQEATKVIFPGAFATSPISLSQAANGYTLRVNASSPITLSHAATGGLNRTRSVTSTIALSHTPTGRTQRIEADVTTLLLIAQEARLPDVIEKEAASSFVLSHTASGTLSSQLVYATSTIVLSHIATANIKMCPAISSISLAHAAFASPVGTRYDVDAENSFSVTEWDETSFSYATTSSLTDEASVVGSTLTYAASNFLTTLEHSASGVVIFTDGRAKSANATTTVALTDLVRIPKHADASSTITITDNADGYFSEDISDQLEISHAANFSVVRVLAAVDTLNLIASFLCEKNSPNVCLYDPVLGGTTDPRYARNFLAQPFGISPQDNITLFYPVINPTSTIELRNPELGNRNRLEFQRINRETRGGTLIVAADPDWPKQERILLEIRGLSESKVDSLRAFILASLGQEIGFTDWEGNTFRAILMNPEEATVRNRTCDTSITLELEVSYTTIMQAIIDQLDVEDACDNDMVWSRPATTTVSGGGWGLMQTASCIKN